MPVFKAVLILSLIILSHCFQAKRAPFDTSSPEGLIRNLTLQILRLPTAPNRAPIVKSFNASTKSIAFGMNFQITWEVVDPEGDPIKCELDLEPDGVVDYTDSNCGTASLEFSIQKTGLFTPVLKVSDAYNQAIDVPMEGKPIYSQLAGTKDSSFTSYGFSSQAVEILVQPNGKILVLANGAADSQLLLFQENGEYLSNRYFIDKELKALALQPDGKILVGGVGENYYYYIARLLPDLNFDPSFGAGGEVTIFDDTNYKILEALQVDASGRIVGVGTYYSTLKYSVFRLHANGSLDTSFGSGGIKIFQADSNENQLYGLSILPSGKILVSGHATNGSDGQFVLARLNTDGNLDNSFGTDGIAKKSFVQAAVGMRHAIQKDGKIIVCGNSTDTANDNIFTLVRFHENGSVDTSFGSGGVVTTDILSGNDRAYSVLALEDGKILASGVAGVETLFGIPTAIRYLPNGSIDTSFGVNGIYLDSNYTYNFAAALDKSGRLLMSAQNIDYYMIVIRIK